MFIPPDFKDEDRRLYFVNEFTEKKSSPLPKLEKGRFYVGYKTTEGHYIIPKPSNGRMRVGVVFDELQHDGELSSYDISVVEENDFIDYIDLMNDEDKTMATKFFSGEVIDPFQEQLEKLPAPNKDEMIDKIVNSLITEDGSDIEFGEFDFNEEEEEEYPNFVAIINKTLDFMEKNNYKEKMNGGGILYTPDSLVILMREFYFDYIENNKSFDEKKLIQFLARVIITIEKIYNK